MRGLQKNRKTRPQQNENTHKQKKQREKRSHRDFGIFLELEREAPLLLSLALARYSQIPNNHLHETLLSATAKAAGRRRRRFWSFPFFSTFATAAAAAFAFGLFFLAFGFFPYEKPSWTPGPIPPKFPLRSGCLVFIVLVVCRRIFS